MHDVISPSDIRSWIKETERDDERRYQYIKPFLSDRSLLDIGCGTGNFLLKAKNDSETTHGIEPEKKLKNHYEKLGLTVYPNLSDITQGQRYDLITMFHVLEHLPDPLETLGEIKRLLKKKGRLIVEVPSSDDALLTLYKCKAFSRFTYWSCHLFLFNAKTLETLCRKAGFNVDYIQQVQRFPLSNHLHWLARNAPGGHSLWSFLENGSLNAEYAGALARLGLCDTLVTSLSLDS